MVEDSTFDYLHHVCVNVLQFNYTLCSTLLANQRPQNIAHSHREASSFVDISSGMRGWENANRKFRNFQLKCCEISKFYSKENVFIGYN